MQVGLLGVAAAGAAFGQASVVVNAVGGLGVTFLPALLERDARVPVGADLALWVTGAALLHAVGAVSIPGSPGNLYSQLWWWDHLTHTASAAVVAGVGYGVVRTLDAHELVSLPPPTAFVVTLSIVLAVGVYWEVFEWAVGHLEVFGQTALTQYGAGDTAADLAFDGLGGLAVAGWAVLRLGVTETDD